MNGYYSGKIKVICNDLMCFPVNPTTLEPLSCESYDAYAITDPDSEPVETISHSEWCKRRDKQRTIRSK
jgi:hypothetical protein